MKELIAELEKVLKGSVSLDVEYYLSGGNIVATSARGMQILIKSINDNRFEIVYEEALHIIDRITVNGKNKLFDTIVTIFNRSVLTKVKNRE